MTSTGHCHPKVVAAIQEQATRFIHAQVNCYRHPLLEALADRLAEITPDGIDRFFFANSGAEATEGAVKLAKQTTGRPNMIVFQGSFHGRTHQTMAMTTSKTSYRAGLRAAARRACSSRRSRSPMPTETDWCLDQVRFLLKSQTAPSETAAIVIEPVLGEGGYLPAPVPFLRGLEAICREHGILFIADEVQTGFGRTGRMFAVEHYGVRPDVLVMAKGIGSGFPISAIGASDELMARWPKGSHGGTYGGNPIGCAAALATIDVLTEPGFLDNVNERGEQLQSGLAELARRRRRHHRRAGLGPHGRVAVRRSRTRRGGAGALPRGGAPDPDERRHEQRRAALDAAARRHRGRDRHRARRLRRGAEVDGLTWRPTPGRPGAVSRSGTRSWWPTPASSPSSSVSSPTNALSSSLGTTCSSSWPTPADGCGCRSSPVGWSSPAAASPARSTGWRQRASSSASRRTRMGEARSPC